MSFGKTVAALNLEKEICRAPEYGKKVGNIMTAFHKGLKILSSIEDKSMFDVFFRLWMARNRDFIKGCKLPDEIKVSLLSAVFGSGRRCFRQKMVKECWMSKEKMKALEEADRKHDEEFELRRKQDQQDA